MATKPHFAQAPRPARQLDLENIEELRRAQGIDDVELRLEIRALHTGDLVRLTFLTEAKGFETGLVRITRIQGSAFRGVLVKRLPRVPAGERIEFTSAHIHSVPKKTAI